MQSCVVAVKCTCFLVKLVIIGIAQELREKRARKEKCATFWFGFLGEKRTRLTGVSCLTSVEPG